MFRTGALLLSFAAARVNGQTGAGISQPDPNDPCTVCFDSQTPVTDPTFKYFNQPTETTCQGIIDGVAAASTTQGTETCKNYQLAAFQLGCCGSPPYEYCPVCPDGSDFTRSNEIPFGTAEVTTCAENLYRPASYNGIFKEGICSDTVIQRGAFYCDCPGVEQQCSLCKDGSPPGNPDRGEAWVTNSNCEGLAFLISLFTAEECEGSRDNYGVDFAHFCLCPNHTKAVEEECSMCEGGIANPDYTYTSEGDAFTRTCAQADDFAKSITRENICMTLMQGVLDKGCKCNSGGPVFKVPDESGAISLGSTLSAIAMLSLVLKGLLA